MGAALQLYNRSVSDALYGYALSSAYSSQWVYDPSGTSLRDPDFWEHVRNDPAFLSSIDRSSKSIVRPWHIEAPKGAKDKLSKSFASICEEGLGRIHRFNASRRVLSEARFLGRRYAYIESEIECTGLDGSQPMDWVVPKRLKDVDYRRFHWSANVTRDANNVPRREVKLQLFNTISSQWVDLSVRDRSNFIEYIYTNTEDRVGYGRGYKEAIYFAHWMKTNTFQKIMQGVDRWAGGVWIGKLDSLRNASTSKTNEDLRVGMKRVLTDMRANNIAVLQDGDEIEVKETTGAGHQISMDVVNYWDDVVERLCNGSTRPSGQGSSATGARAQAETESDTSEAFYQDDREDLDAILDRDLLGWFINVNRGNFARLGMIEKCKRPKFSSEQIKKQDPKEAVEVAQALQSIGFPLSLAEVAEKSGYSIADPDEEQLKAPATDMGGLGSPFGGGGGFGGAKPESKSESSKVGTED